MEDFSEARIDDVDGEKVGMFGVYDGMFCLSLPAAPSCSARQGSDIKSGANSLDFHSLSTP